MRIHSLRLCQPDSIGLGIRVICVSVEGKQIGIVGVVLVTAHDVRTVILVEWIHRGETESDCSGEAMAHSSANLAAMTR